MTNWANRSGSSNSQGVKFKKEDFKYAGIKSNPDLAAQVEQASMNFAYEGNLVPCFKLNEFPNLDETNHILGAFYDPDTQSPVDKDVTMNWNDWERVEHAPYDFAHIMNFIQSKNLDVAESLVHECYGLDGNREAQQELLDKKEIPFFDQVHRKNIPPSLIDGFTMLPNLHYANQSKVELIDEKLSQQADGIHIAIDGTRANELNTMINQWNEAKEKLLPLLDEEKHRWGNKRDRMVRGAIETVDMYLDGVKSITRGNITQKDIYAMSNLSEALFSSLNIIAFRITEEMLESVNNGYGSVPKYELESMHKLAPELKEATKEVLEGGYNIAGAARELYYHEVMPKVSEKLGIEGQSVG